MSKSLLPLVVLTLLVLLGPIELSFGQSNPLGSEVLSEPALFAPGVISTGDYELNAAFEPDGQTVYLTKSTPDSRFSLMTIVSSRFLNGRWQTPKVASFSGQYSEVDPFLSPDGSKLYYISYRPIGGTEARDNFDIWFVDRTDAGWSEPRHLGAPINTENQEYYPAVTADGTIYFSADREDTKGRYDLYRSRLVDGNYSEPENLGDAINSEFSEIDVYVAPDESYIIFVSYRPDGQGRGDLYISHNKEGVWTSAKNLGDTVNSPSREYCPMVSPDGRYLFFTSERAFFDQSIKGPLVYDQLIQRIRAPGNGMGDVYQISLSALSY